MSATIEIGEKIKCKECGREFRWIPRNTTIKPKLCLICHNKKLLERANFNRKEKNNFKTGKHTPKGKNGRKVIKTPHDRFYKSTAWKWFSRYILLYYSNDNVVRCSTCGTFKRVNDKEMHTGHWIKVFDANSTNYSTAFEFTNLAPQCSRCNCKMGGRERLMQNWLKEKHGQAELDRLQELSKQPLKLDDYTLQKIADEYREKFNEILKERGCKNPWKK